MSLIIGHFSLLILFTGSSRLNNEGGQNSKSKSTVCETTLCPNAQGQVCMLTDPQKQTQFINLIVTRPYHLTSVLDLTEALEVK